MVVLVLCVYMIQKNDEEHMKKVLFSIDLKEVYERKDVNFKELSFIHIQN